MPDTLLLLFYLSGTLFFIVALVLLISVMAFLWWLTQRITLFEAEAKERLQHLQSETNNMASLKNAYPLVVSTAINLGYHFLRKRFKN